MSSNPVILKASPFTAYLVISRWEDGTMGIEPASTEQQMIALIKRRKNDLAGLDAKVFSVALEDK